MHETFSFGYGQAINKDTGEFETVVADTEEHVWAVAQSEEAAAFLTRAINKALVLEREVPELRIARASALFDRIAGWGERTFGSGGATPEGVRDKAQGAINHLLRELHELQESVTQFDGSLESGEAVQEELADSVMCLVQAAGALSIDLEGAIRAKLAVNKARQWGEEQADGVVEHVRENRGEFVGCPNCGAEKSQDAGEHCNGDEYHCPMIEFESWEAGHVHLAARLNRY